MRYMCLTMSQIDPNKRFFGSAFSPFELTRQTNTYLKSIIETLEKVVTSVQR